MNPKLVNIVTGFIGLSLLATFVIGLAISISSGFAGVRGALPFSIIVGLVICLVLYDFWDQCFRSRRDEEY